MVSVTYLAASTTTLASSQDPAPLRAAVTFTAAVTGAMPTGTVAFEADGATISGCAAQAVDLVSSTASCTTSALAAGVHAITARYSGDGANAGGVSADLMQEVVGEPAATILTPASGGTYTLGQSAQTSFLCSDAAYGPGVSSCDDSTGTDTLAGGSGQLDTSSPGRHVLEVTGTSRDGQTGTATIRYTVALPPPAVAIGTGRAPVTRGRAQLRLTCTGRSGRACDDSLTLAIARRTGTNGGRGRPGTLRTIVLGSARFKVSDGRSRLVTVRLTVAGLKLLAHAAHDRFRVGHGQAQRRTGRRPLAPAAAARAVLTGARGPSTRSEAASTGVAWRRSDVKIGLNTLNERVRAAGCGPGFRPAPRLRLARRRLIAG